MRCLRRETLRRLYYANSGENPRSPITMVAPAGGSLVETLDAPDGSMGFLPDVILDAYAAAYSHTGFGGALNGYRVFTRNWWLTAPWAGMRLPVPSAFIGGTKDTVLAFPGFRAAAEAMGTATFIDGAGHWVQQERPEVVNAAMLDFLTALRTTGVFM
jgi:pimeloyl-ACP methyl ester carboxylesterase